MRVLVLGATGGTGRFVLTSALAAGHEVTALVRDPAALGAVDGVRVIVGDATSEADVRKAVDGQEAILNALGSRNLRRPVEAESTSVLVAAAVEAGVQRLVVCSAFGVGDTADDAGALPRLFFRTVLGAVYDAKEIADRAVRESPLDWTLVYPTRLVDTPATGRLLTVESFSGTGRVPRADVARFMVDQLESAEWSRKTVIVSGR